MSSRRIVASTILVATCALALVLGVANAGKAPDPRGEVPLTQPAERAPTLEELIEQAKQRIPPMERSPIPPVSLPAGWACPGTEGVQNIHVRLGPPPDYLSEGRAMGMSDADARAYAATKEAAQKAIEDQVRASVATLPPPPC